MFLPAVRSGEQNPATHELVRQTAAKIRRQYASRGDRPRCGSANPPRSGLPLRGRPQVPCHGTG
ncbi:hypothetical protein GO011_07935 [Mycobacterium sp. 20091114027_K0903767]|nr:hypothetical protein [Mycobacterium sp. 20091114027_K0903767]